MYINKKQAYYVYSDSTIDGNIYYIGKGTYSRTRKVRRNKLHSKVLLKFGFKRTILFVTDDEEVAYQVEKEYIKMFKTYYNDPNANQPFATNKDNGGPGRSSSQLKKTREKISKTRKKQIKENGHSSIGKKYSNSHKDKISNSLKEHYSTFGHHTTGTSVPSKTKNKMSKTMKEKYKNGYVNPAQTPESHIKQFFKNHQHRLRVVDKTKRNKLSEEDKPGIKLMRDNKIPIRIIAEYYCVSRRTINRFIKK